MTTNHQRKLATGEALDDKKCPECGHRYGSHRGIPGCTGTESECIVLMGAVAYTDACGCRAQPWREATR